MTESMGSPKSPQERLKRWLLKIRTVEAAVPEAKEDRPDQHSWWQVVCLTGVDYFSTLGYMTSWTCRCLIPLRSTMFCPRL
jgi:hypothetical protein